MSAEAGTAEYVATAHHPARPRARVPGNQVVKWMTTTDHKTIGTLYLVTSFAFFCIGGVMALLMRAELARPGLQIMSNEQFNQAFTMHGTIMLLMFATPLFAGFANVIMPLQIGAPDVAFPRLNAFSFWLFLFGSTIVVSGFFTPGGAMAMLIRTELARPGQQFLSQDQYNQLFTMHGTVMLLLYATPILFGFANFVLPLQIGSPDVAFPRLNAFSYWLYLFGGLIVMSGFLTPGGAADFGWFAYTPLSDAIHSPGVGADLWISGLIVGGLGTILGAVNMITTVVSMFTPPRMVPRPERIRPTIHRSPPTPGEWILSDSGV